MKEITNEETSRRGRPFGVTKTDIVSNIDGSRITELRVEKRWTQEFLAKSSRVSKGTMSQLENNPAYRISRQALGRVAAALEVDSESLLRIGIIQASEVRPEDKERMLIESLRSLTIALSKAEKLHKRLEASISEIRTLISLIGASLDESD